MKPGIVDTNVLVAALTRDSYSPECIAFCRALRAGTVSAYFDVLVAHELAYVLPRVTKMNRNAIAIYLNEILSWPGIVADKETLISAISSWTQFSSVSFVDAYLGALARRDGAPVYTKNIRDFSIQGVGVPATLPDGNIP